MTASPRKLRIEDLPGLVGERLGESAWHAVTQEQVDAFAEATGDRAWIHVDPVRAKSGPYGGTIAHGFLTLALIPVLTAEVFEIEGGGLHVNYGVNAARFPAPLPVGARVRLDTTLNQVETTKAGERLTLGFALHCDAVPKPVAVGETVLLVVPGIGDG